MGNVSVISKTPCGAQWLEGIEGGCQLEVGHTAEHRAKLKIFYGDGQIGEAEVRWISDANFNRGHVAAGPLDGKSVEQPLTNNQP